MVPADPAPPATVPLEAVLADLRAEARARGVGRVVVAMSGGVDSSVTAALLCRAGLEVVGVSLRLFERPEGAGEGACCTLDDFQDARRVAQDLGFPHYILDFQARFRSQVIAPFLEDYLHGMTPNPCINCNKNLKFDHLLERALGLGASHVATGHYARIAPGSPGLALLRATDPGKDQSYFLYHLNQKTLSHVLFPLGGHPKATVRDLGRQMGLHLAEKSESQDICFVPEGRYGDFLRTEGAVGPDRPGPILALDGRRLGTHPGHWHFTVGQRRGLGVAAARPLFVVRVDPEANAIWVGGEADLAATALEAREVAWCRGVPSGPLACTARIRSRSADAPAEVSPLPGGRASVAFQDPQRAVAPGQAVVFYRGDEVLGGGVIAAPRP